MAYPRTIDAIIDEVPAVPDIGATLDDPASPLNRDPLRERIVGRSAQIWQALTSQTDAYKRTQTALHSAGAARDARIAVPTWFVTVGNGYSAAAAFRVIAGTVFLVAAGVGARWPATCIHWAWTQPWSMPVLAVVAAVSVAILLAYVFSRPAADRANIQRLDSSGQTQRLDALRVSLQAQVRAEVTKLATELINDANQTFFQASLYVSG